MTVDIKVGDKVQVDMDTPTASFHGVEGIVEEITPGKSSGYVRITKSNSKVEGNFPAGTRMYLYGLTKMEETFTFKDIQKGDKVRRTETWESGTVRSVEGIVVNLSNIVATTKESLVVGQYRDEDNKHLVLELLDRPEPKHWLDTKPVGAIGLFGQDEYKKVLKKTAEDTWEVTFVVSTRTYTLNSEQCLGQWPSLKHETDDKIEWLK